MAEEAKAHPFTDVHGEHSPHPQAFQVLYDAYRHLGCPAAVDPVDPDDCASVADESVRVLLAAGLLPPPGTRTCDALCRDIEADRDRLVAAIVTWRDSYAGEPAHVADRELIAIADIIRDA